MRDDLVSARRDGEAMRFAPHLASHATRYFGDLADGPVQVRLRWHSDRRLSRLDQFELESGGHSHGVMVKVPRGLLDGASPGGRAGQQEPPGICGAFRDARAV